MSYRLMRRLTSPVAVIASILLVSPALGANLPPSQTGAAVDKVAAQIQATALQVQRAYQAAGKTPAQTAEAVQVAINTVVARSGLGINAPVALGRAALALQASNPSTAAIITDSRLTLQNSVFNVNIAQQYADKRTKAAFLASVIATAAKNAEAQAEKEGKTGPEVQAAIEAAVGMMIAYTGDPPDVVTAAMSQLQTSLGSEKGSVLQSAVSEMSMVIASTTQTQTASTGASGQAKTTSTPTQATNQTSNAPAALGTQGGAATGSAAFGGAAGGAAGGGSGGGGGGGGSAYRSG